MDPVYSTLVLFEVPPPLCLKTIAVVEFVGEIRKSQNVLMLCVVWYVSRPLAPPCGPGYTEWKCRRQVSVLSRGDNE